MKQHMFKLRSKPQGSQHIRITVFAGYDDQTLANCGALIMNVDEWQAFRALLSLGANFTPAKVIIEGEL